MIFFLGIWAAILIGGAPLVFTAWRMGKAHGIDEHRAGTLVDHPCSRCGMPTGWSWFGQPLCPTCRKREIEEAS